MRRALHLRTKLLLTTLGLLTAICATIGVVGYTAMNVFLTHQLDDQLTASSQRAVRFDGGDGRGGRPGPGGLPSGFTDGSTDGMAAGTRPDPLDAPGQGAGTLNARVAGGTVSSAGVVVADGSKVELSAADIEVLRGLTVQAGPVDRTLSAGGYRLMAAEAADSVVITGLPLAEKNETLLSLALTTLTVSAAGLLATGLLGLLLIRRSLRPLEQLAGVASRVAVMPLDEGEVALAERVDTSASTDTEVGRVGAAFNRMLDNVGSALSARHRSESQVRRFVADASHELRTPLTSIRGYAEMIRLTEPLTSDGVRSLGRVEAEAKRMGALVEDLLLLARLDEGGPRAEAEVDLTELLLESVGDVRVAARSHAWELRLPEDPVLVCGDGSQLRRVLINLLANAHLHTPAGTAIVTSLAVEDTGDGGTAVLSILDNGPGIPADFQERIFSRFARLDAARAAAGPAAPGGVSKSSSGLGLAIVESIVQAHGGIIAVDSRPGRTEFIVRLPRLS